MHPKHMCLFATKNESRQVWQQVPRGHWDTLICVFHCFAALRLSRRLMINNTGQYQQYFYVTTPRQLLPLMSRACFMSADLSFNSSSLVLEHRKQDDYPCLGRSLHFLPAMQSSRSPLCYRMTVFTWWRLCAKWWHNCLQNTPTGAFRMWHHLSATLILRDIVNLGNNMMQRRPWKIERVGLHLKHWTEKSSAHPHHNLVCAHLLTARMVNNIILTVCLFNQCVSPL